MKTPLSPWSAVCGALFLGALPVPAAVLFNLPGSQVATGGGNGVSLVDTSNDTGDWITAGGYAAGSATVPLYFSFTANVTNNTGETGAGGFFTALQLFKSGERFAVGNNWGSVNWGGFFGPAEYDLTGAPAIVPNTAVNFVFKLDQAANTATVWFNPNLTLLEAAQPAGITTVRSGLGTNDEFESINIRAGNDAGSTTFSNLTIQNTSPFGVPQPTTGLLAGLALLGMMRRRR
jgi:hypothetical protein